METSLKYNDREWNRLSENDFGQRFAHTDKMN